MNTAETPRAKPGLICPLHRKDMAKVCHTCPLWISVRGTNPNTGAEVDDWRCSLAWLPMLLIENAQQTRQSGAATESMRNAIVERMDRPPVIATGAPPRMLEK